MSALSVTREVRALLRAEGAFAPAATLDEARPVAWRRLALLVVLPAAAYGAVMGAFDLRPLQSLYSASKVPIFLGLSTLTALPSSYVVHALLGLHDDFGRSTRGVLAAQGTLAVTLASLAPMTAFVYASTGDYFAAQVANGSAFLAASLAGQVTLARHFRPLLARSARHRVTLGSWLVLHTFVAIQLAWILRPFIGSPNLATTFLREHAFQNAYVELSGLFARVLGLG